MHHRHCLKIAERIHLLLVRELGQGLERQRMLHEPLYARDVLLVCDAMRHTDAPYLARHFRRSAASPDEANLTTPHKPSASTRSRLLHSLLRPAASLKAALAPRRLATRPGPVN
jgi:hypothetical protein